MLDLAETPDPEDPKEEVDIVLSPREPSREKEYRIVEKGLISIKDKIGKILGNNAVNKANIPSELLELMEKINSYVIIWKISSEGEGVDIDDRDGDATKEILVKNEDVNPLFEAMEQFAFLSKDCEVGDEIRPFAMQVKNFVQNPSVRSLFSAQKNIALGFVDEFNSSEKIVDGLPYMCWLSQIADLVTENPAEKSLFNLWSDLWRARGTTLEKKLKYVKENQGTIEFLAHMILDTEDEIYDTENLLCAFKTFKELKESSSNANEFYKKFINAIGEKYVGDPIDNPNNVLFDLMYLLVNGKDLPKVSILVSPEIKANIDQLATMDDPAGKELSDLFGEKTTITCQTMSDLWWATLEKKLKYVKEKYVKENQGTIKLLARENTYEIYDTENLLCAFKIFKELKGNSPNANEFLKKFVDAMGEKYVDGPIEYADDSIEKEAFTHILFALMHLLVDGKDLPKIDILVSPEVKANIDQLATMDDPAGKELLDLFGERTTITCQWNEVVAGIGEHPQEEQLVVHLR
jgi:hypothetical protein